MLQLEPTLLTAALFAPFLLEALKRVIRRFVVKNAEYDFSKRQYAVMIPFATLLAQLVTGYLGWSPLPDVSGSYVLQWFVGVLITLASYNMAIAPFKAYRANNY